MPHSRLSRRTVLRVGSLAFAASVLSHSNLTAFVGSGFFILGFYLEEKLESERLRLRAFRRPSAPAKSRSLPHSESA